MTHFVCSSISNTLKLISLLLVGKLISVKKDDAKVWLIFCLSLSIAYTLILISLFSDRDCFSQ
jgi:hypothetical protein